jgi:hypothetical protein
VLNLRRGGGKYYRECLWLCLQRCAGTWCRKVLILAQGLNILLRPRAQRCHGSEEGLGGGGLHLGSRMVAVLSLLNWSFHVVKCVRLLERE